MSPRARYIWNIVKQGPTEIGYAFFRARRRRRNLADTELKLSESDRIGLERAYDVSARDLTATAELLEAQEAAETLDIRTVQWFLPFFHHPYFAGVYTILRFADHLAREHGVESRFCIYDVTPKPVPDIARKIGEAFPALAEAEVTAATTVDRRPAYAHLRQCDAAVGTLWTSIFPLLRFNRTRAKFYFVQDYEPAFYPAGSASALAELTWSLGLPGIVNTPGLAESYRAHGNPAIGFTPAVDTHRYHPADATRDPDGPVRLFFYARPSNPRNAFGLGMTTLRAVKDAYQDRVQIVCAGQDWNPGQYGMSHVIENLGVLPDLDSVAELYRTIDIGLVFMLTRHPSYQPFEFMASGVACVSNANPDTDWLLRHEHNALTAPPSASLVASQIGRLIDDPALRQQLARTALAEVGQVRWDEQIERVWGAMTKRGEPFEPPGTPALLSSRAPG